MGNQAGTAAAGQAKSDAPAHLCVDFAYCFETLETDIYEWQQRPENKGRRLHGSQAHTLARIIVSRCWHQLDALRRTDPQKFQEYRTGQHETYPFETNNLSLAQLACFPKGIREQLASPQYDGPTESGVAAPLWAKRRNIQLSRKRLTSLGFIAGKVQKNKEGKIDPDGRGNFILEINPRYLFGANWHPLSGVASSDNAPENLPQVSAPKNQYSVKTALTTPNSNKTALLRKETEERDAEFSDENDRPSVSAEPTKSCETTAQRQGSLPEAIGHEKNFPAGGGEKSGGVGQSAPAAAPEMPETETWASAKRLWAALLTQIFLPMLAAGRLRWSKDRVFAGEIRSATVNECLKMLVQNLKAAREGDETPAATEIRLLDAVGKWREWLEKDPERFVYVPTQALRTDYTSGCLLSSVRQFLREHAPQQPTVPDIAPGEMPEKDRIRLLYARICGLGCAKIFRGTFSRWIRKHGFLHVEACIEVFIENAARRRAAGAAKGSEYKDPSKYLAGLVISYQSDGVKLEKDRRDRVATKRALEDAADLLSNRNLSPEQAALKAELHGLFQKMSADSEFSQQAMRAMNEYFGTTIPKFDNIRNLNLVRYALEIQAKTSTEK